METVFVKYSRERAAKFQIKTSIHFEENRKYVVKEALNQEARAHVHTIYNNYETLKSMYLTQLLVTPLYCEEGAIAFDYLEGESLDQIIIRAAMQKKLPRIFEVFDKFNDLLDSVAGENYCDFFNSPNFIDTFGEKKELVGLKSFKVSNIDLNLDNIILNEKDLLQIIDYEWVLNFPIPLNFIRFRAINSFYFSHFEILRNVVGIEKLFEYSGLSEDEVPIYIDMAYKFADIVGTDKHNLLLEKYAKKVIPFEFKEPINYRAQLFYSKTTEYLEDRSVTQDIFLTENTINFDLSTKGEIRSLRFDPLEGKGAVLLQGAQLVDKLGNLQDLQVHWSNADYMDEGFMIFLEDDPQIYYEIECREYERVQISLKYINYFSEDVLLGLKKQSLRHSNEMLKLETNVLKLGDDIEALKQEKRKAEDELALKIVSLVEEKKTLEHENIQARNTLVQKTEEISLLQGDLQSSYAKSEALISEIERLQDNNSNLSIDLKSKEELIYEMVNSKWWKLGEFLRKPFRGKNN